jgi:hypothetical protein
MPFQVSVSDLGAEHNDGDSSRSIGIEHNEDAIANLYVDGIDRYSGFEKVSPFRKRHGLDLSVMRFHIQGVSETSLPITSATPDAIALTLQPMAWDADDETASEVRPNSPEFALRQITSTHDRPERSRWRGRCCACR